jgi:RimJ/RimL family protein N-acetyltransferase
MILGENVGLRAVERKDLGLLRDWRNLQAFRRNFREVRELNMENQEQWFMRSCVNNPNDFMFIVEDLETGEAIGAAGLLYINWIIRSADFSFYIGKNEEYVCADSFALEGAKLLINYGFEQLNLNKIWMELYEYDKAKYDFFTQSFAFKKDGVLRQNCFTDGKYWDSVIISIIRKDFMY